MPAPQPAGRPPLSDPLPAEPGPALAAWLAEAARNDRYPNPTAFTLATVDPDGRPSARVVLGHRFDPEAVSLDFHTNRLGRKARALAARPFAAAVFSFHADGRQARLEGQVTPLDDATSDAYFATRPLAAQLSAWASAQSEPIASRAALVEAWRATARRFGVDPDAPEGRDATPASLPRPPAWGGYRLFAEQVELWISGEARLHDCARWTRRLAPEPGPWQVCRIQP